ncbi:hypothetical protein F4778DRAFT_721922 [Xylariomycetidae sp. FL2044]|nr:hypothetical protein F4778DRAFT_721922 [Xylariomycetidae sp. FL2044]
MRSRRDECLLSPAHLVVFDIISIVLSVCQIQDKKERKNISYWGRTLARTICLKVGVGMDKVFVILIITSYMHASSQVSYKLVKDTLGVAGVP